MGPSRGGTAGPGHSTGWAEPPMQGSFPAEPAAGAAPAPLGQGSGVPCSRGAARSVASSQDSSLTKRKSHVTVIWPISWLQLWPTADVYRGTE